MCDKPQYGAIAKGSHQQIGPRFVRQTDIVLGRIDWSTVPYCDLSPSDFNKYSLRRGDLLISRLGNGVGNAAIVQNANDAVFAGYLVRFRTLASKADPDFVGYQLQSDAWRQHVVGFRSGAAQPTLNAQQMGEFKFLLPPLHEQAAIAATLGALDDKIESNRRVISIASDLLDAIADRSSQDLEGAPLSELTYNSRSVVDPSRIGDELVDHFSLPAFDSAVWPERTPASAIMSNKLVVDRPSILISRLNPRFNRTWWVVPEGSVIALASTEFSCLSAETRPELAALWLAVRDRYFRGELTHRVTGTSGSHQRIRPDDLLSIEVPNTRQLSDAVKQRVLDLLDLIHIRRREIVRLTALRDGLLPELLSGRVRVLETPRAVRGVVT
ncbi:restriction endonuclease subunit S [Ferrimicrobium sp.]|uniref:restriction endonuclease subunit S n=1 Tax=Ferrimicrobium sp. TaxID=2926050 RepID=UPI00262DB5E2|nr:restriction endonuclease subunit S [Ferrimicrobium sp.]